MNYEIERILPRRIVKDLFEKGSTSSERSVTEKIPKLFGNRFANFPSIYQGQVLTRRQAADKIIAAKGKDPDTGRVINIFPGTKKGLAAANKAAGIRSDILSTLWPMTKALEELNPPEDRSRITFKDKKLFKKKKKK